MSRHVLFALAVLAQAAILAVVPTQKLVIRRVTGKVITLRTRPVDPYDVMRGHYMTLSYEISQPPGYTNPAEGTVTVYAVLRKDSSNVWNAVAVTNALPRGLGGDQAVIRGTVMPKARRWNAPIRYGIEEYFVPENMRFEISDAMRGARQTALVDVAVDSRGRSSLLRLKIGEKVYEY